MTTTYHERWFQHAGKPIGSIDEEEARRRYERSEPFCIVQSHDGVPVSYLELGAGTVAVAFLDQHRQQRLRYSFVPEGERLFLSQALLFERDEGGEIVRREGYFFRTDGSVTTTHAGRDPKLGTKVESTTDVTHNWEEVPGFDGLLALAVEERGPGSA